MKLVNVELTRQMGIIPTDLLNKRVRIIGAGAIGSWVTLSLAKMGVKSLKVIDFDKVEKENLNSQFYRGHDVGEYKVDALRSLVYGFTEVYITVCRDKFSDSVQGDPEIVISAVDSMSARRDILNAHKKRGSSARFLIDARMGAEIALLYVVNLKDKKEVESYEKSLYSDEEAVQERCTEKAIIYTANMLSGLVCKAFKDILTRKDYVRRVRWSIKEDQIRAFKMGQDCEDNSKKKLVKKLVVKKKTNGRPYSRDLRS